MSANNKDSQLIWEAYSQGDEIKSQKFELPDYIIKEAIPDTSIGGMGGSGSPGGAQLAADATPGFWENMGQWMMNIMKGTPDFLIKTIAKFGVETIEQFKQSTSHGMGQLGASAAGAAAGWNAPRLLAHILNKTAEAITQHAKKTLNLKRARLGAQASKMAKDRNREQRDLGRWEGDEAAAMEVGDDTFYDNNPIPDTPTSQKDLEKVEKLLSDIRTDFMTGRYRNSPVAALFKGSIRGVAKLLNTNTIKWLSSIAGTAIGSAAGASLWESDSNTEDKKSPL